LGGTDGNGGVRGKASAPRGTDGRDNDKRGADRGRGRGDSGGGSVGQTGSVHCHASVSVIGDEDVASGVVEFGVIRSAQCVQSDGSSLVGSSSIERGLTNDGGEFGSIVSVLNTGNDNNAIVFPISDKELIAKGVNINTGRASEGIFAGARGV